MPTPVDISATTDSPDIRPPPPAAAAGGTGKYTAIDPGKTTDDPTALNISPGELTNIPEAQTPPDEPGWMGPVRATETIAQPLIVGAAATGGAVGGTLATGGPWGGVAGAVGAAGGANALTSAGFNALNAKLLGKQTNVLAPGEVLPWTNYKGGKLAEDFVFGGMGELVMGQGLPYATGVYNAAKQALAAGDAAQKEALARLGPLAVVQKIYKDLGTTPEQVAAQRAAGVGDIAVSPSVAAQDAYFAGRGEVYRQQISDKYDAVLDPHRAKLVQTAQQGVKGSGFGSEIYGSLQDLSDTGRVGQISPKAYKIFNDAIFYGGGENGDAIPYSIGKENFVPRASASVDELLNTKSRLVGILMGSGSNTEKSIARQAIDSIDGQLENSGQLPQDARDQLVKLGKTTRDFYDVFQTTAGGQIGKAATTPEIGENIFGKDQRQAMSIIKNGTPEQVDQLRQVFADTVATQGDMSATFQFLQRNGDVLKALYPGEFGEIGRVMGLMGYGETVIQNIKADPRLMALATKEFQKAVDNNPPLLQELQDIKAGAQKEQIKHLSMPARFLASRLGYGAMVAGPLALITSSPFYYARLGVMSTAGVPFLVNFGLRALLARSPGAAGAFFNAFVKNPRNAATGARLLMQLGSSYIANLTTQQVRSFALGEVQEQAAFDKQFPPVQIPGQQ
jgi:hypothetical protein